MPPENRIPTQFEYSEHVFRSPKFRSVVDEAVEFFAQTPLQTLPPLSRFIGGGVYALYYVGEYDLYLKLSEVNRKDCMYPIYMGKAVPPGGRTGRAKSSTTPDLYQRLREHMRNLEQAENVQVDEFRCRFVILNDVESDLIVPVEANLIRQYKPLWNMVVDGFGNHDPGSGRYNQAKSDWDVLHPGRPWAERLTGVPPALDEIMAKVQSHLEGLGLS
jgi:hypothetical protein